MASWFDKRLAPTPSHNTYILLSAFLILYALFSSFIRNRLHLSEPPLAMLFGIIFGPRGARLIDPTSWGIEDNITHEATRIVVGLQVFSVGIGLPRPFFAKPRNRISVGMLLGPVMIVSWLITAALVKGIIPHTAWTTALIISACLAPTDPVLAAAVLAESRFAQRVPARLRHLLSAESGCNDGTSFPFLFLALYAVLEPNIGSALREWALGTVLWQCILGLAIGLLVGTIFHHLLRYVTYLNYVDRPAFIVFYILLAIFSVGIGSILGVDDFLVAFGAGYAFSWDGWFRRKMRATRLPAVLDLLLNSSMFVYFGTIVPWDAFTPRPITPDITPGRLVALLVLILLLRRIPIVLLLKRFIPDIKTYQEALFAGHFGPMGLGALFLVIEARAELENGTAEPEPHLIYPQARTHPFLTSMQQPLPPSTPHRKAIETTWPIVCFIIFGSTMVHGLSVAAISLGAHWSRKEGERAPLLTGETDGLGGMVHDDERESSVSDPSDEEDEEEQEEERAR